MTETIDLGNDLPIIEQPPIVDPRILEAQENPHLGGATNSAQTEEILGEAIDATTRVLSGGAQVEAVDSSHEMETNPYEGIVVPISGGRNVIRGSVHGSLITDIPLEAFKIDSAESRSPVVSLTVAAMEDMPEGDYHLSNYDRDGKGIAAVLSVRTTPEGEKYYGIKRTISYPEQVEDPEIVEACNVPTEKQTIIVGEFGARDMVEGLPSILRLESKAYTEMFLKLGFQMDDEGKITGYPVPSVFARRYQEHFGIPVKRVDIAKENGLMPAEEYVRAYSEGAYPIGVGGDLKSGFHDMRDDHASGEAAAGVEAHEMDCDIARAAIPKIQDRAFMVKVGGQLDNASFKKQDLLRNMVGDFKISEFIETMEREYRERCQTVGIDYREGVYTAAVVSGILGNLEKIGVGEEKAKHIRTRYGYAAQLPAAA